MRGPRPFRRLPARRSLCASRAKPRRSRSAPPDARRVIASPSCAATRTDVARSADRRTLHVLASQSGVSCCLWRVEGPRDRATGAETVGDEHEAPPSTGRRAPYLRTMPAGRRPALPRLIGDISRLESLAKLRSFHQERPILCISIYAPLSHFVILPLSHIIHRATRARSERHALPRDRERPWIPADER